MSGIIIKLLSGGMLAAACCGISSNIVAQRGPRGNNRTVMNMPKDTPAVKQAAGGFNLLRNEGPKPYKEVITAKAVSSRSFMLVHKVDEKYYLEIPDTLLGREMLSINRIEVAPAGFRNNRNPFGYAGDLIGQLIFHFEKADNNRIFLRLKSYRERSEDTSANGLARSLQRNNMEPIINSFAIKAVNDSTHSSVIDITDLLAQDNMLFGFSAAVKNATGIGMPVADRSYIADAKASADNISFGFVRTYNKGTAGLGTAPMPYSFRLLCDISMLPYIPMATRPADKRTGYQEISYIDFDNNPLGVVNTSVICRWRLEPADKAAYAAGRLSAPLKPVKLYIDPATPAQWRPFLKQGIEAWNRAFEKAGFKNAIVVSEGTGRNTIVCMPGNGNNTGNIITDPRTGEILQVQLNFYLGTLNKLYSQYMVQAAAVNKAAQQPVFPVALMGSLVQAYAMQAMGELLGLKQNAGAANSVDIHQLRDNKSLGIRPFNGSATAPLQFNYAAQPGDDISPEQLLPGITATDEWMINWGYRVLPKATEATTLDSLITAWMKNKQTPYSGDQQDWRNQTASLSNDPVQAALLGIYNLKRIVPHLVEWTTEPATDNERAAALYETLLEQYLNYGRIAIGQIGGICVNNRNNNQPGYIYSFVPPAAQKKALEFLQQQVFTTPAWLQDKTLYNRTAQCFDSVMNVQQQLLQELMSKQVLARLQTVARNAPEAAWQPLLFLQQLSTPLFAEMAQNKPVTLPRRELQRIYISRLIALSDTKTEDDLPAVIRYNASALLQLLQQKKSVYTGLMQVHVTDLYQQLYNSLHKTNNDSPTAGRN